MLTCITCPKHPASASLRDHDVDDDEDVDGALSTRQAIKALTSQIKDMSLKASEVYRHCKPCKGSSGGDTRQYEASSSELGLESEQLRYYYRCAGGGEKLRFSSGTAPWVEDLSGCEETPSASGMMAEFMDEEEDSRDWVALVEPGVMLTFFSLPHGRNVLKRIRFSREMYNKLQAQLWWAENHDKVMELYNVASFNHHTISLPTHPTRKDEESPETAPLRYDRLSRHVHSCSTSYLPSNSVDCLQSHHHHYSYHQHHFGRCYDDSGGWPLTLKLSSISGVNTEISTMDASVRTSIYADTNISGELSASVSYACDQERQWVEEDEPGVYITIRVLSGGIRELRRIRFSRERFGEMQARIWWEENRERIHEQYLF